MKIRILLIAFVGLVLCSCSTVYHTASTADVKNCIHSMTVADIEVSQTKAQTSYSWGFNPFRKVNIEIIKDNTTARLLNQIGADVLVEPQFIIETRGFFGGGTVTVTGYPAKYTDFHKPTSEEAQMILESLKKCDCSAPHFKKKKKFLFF